MATYQTYFTELMGCKYPIIAGPMFLVSDEKLVIAACRAGIVGGFPSLNWRTTEGFRAGLATIKKETQGKPFAVNIIVNKANPRVDADLKACLDVGVPMFVTSLGSPKEVIREGHKIGAKIFCDVTTLDYAKKVEDMGADGVIAVSAGAGGHAGPISPFVLIPYLRKHLKIPVIAAGGISDGRAIAAAIALGASGVQIGTRFIASEEAKVDSDYKNAIVKAQPEDIVMTTRISGTPAAVIKTPYIEKMGLHLNPVEKFFLDRPKTKKLAKMLINLRGMKMLEGAVEKTTWKQVWSAGQSVGMIDEILPIEKIVQKLMNEFDEARKEICK
ncbi:MAG: NAD(P)H-dependent flavin oxidoreductase [Bacteriovoracia bacterium]